jgi:hypothetical protein
MCEAQPLAAPAQRAVEAASQWEAVSLPMTGVDYIYGIAALDSGRLIIVGGSTSSPILHTSDSAGRTWTSRTIGGTAAWMSVAAKGDGSKCLAVARAGYSAWSTDSGATWSTTTDIGSGNWRRVACKTDGSVFVILNEASQNTCKRTTDGTTWTAPTLPASVIWRDLVWSEELGLFVAVGDSGNVATSPDGTTWTARSLPGGATTALYAVAWSPPLRLFVAMSVGTATYYTSPDGIAWTARTLPVASLNASPGSIAWGGYIFVAALTDTAGAPQERVLLSPDGITWTVIHPLLDSGAGAVGATYIAGPTDNVRRFFFVGWPPSGSLGDPGSGLSDALPP